MNASTEQPQNMKEQALALMRANRLAEAQTLFSRVCELNAADADAWYFLSCIYGMQGNMEEAGRCCRRAITLHPDHSDAHINLGNVLLCEGKLEEAVLHYQAALRINPNNAGALCSLGNALSAMDHHGDAVANFQAALRLNPNFIEAYYNLGNSQFAQKQYYDAIDNFRHALRLNPNYAAAYNNLGNAYKERGDIALAMENYRTAIRLQPTFARAYNNLAILLKEQGLLQEAYDTAQHALRVQPDFVDALFNLGNINMAQGNVAEGIARFQRVLMLEPDHHAAHSCLFLMMHYLPEYSAEQLLAVAREWGVRYTPPTSSLPMYGNTPDPRRRLRVGYVSGDFYHHPVGYFFESVLNHHDSAHFEIFCYYNHDRHDELTARLRLAAHHWYNIAEQSDECVIRRIREDDIDLLIDLSGHTDRNRLLVFTRKPAPVQATWLGYFDTTGLSTIDHIIGDHYLIPPEEEHQYVEKVLRLPTAYLCYSPPVEEIEPIRLATSATGKLTFGCFNNPAKITEAVITCWSKILLALPLAQLHLKYASFNDTGVRQRYFELFAKQGITSERIKFSGPSPRNKYLEAYQEIDIGLDPFPFNGCTTTMESLWMGVPVVTLRGDRYVSHMGETILKNLGMTECVTNSEEAYIAQAIALASDPTYLAKLRGSLRDRLLNSPLCDGPGFTRYLEDAYRQMWKTWCESQPQSD